MAESLSDILTRLVLEEGGRREADGGRASKEVHLAIFGMLEAGSRIISISAPARRLFLMYNISQGGAGRNSKFPHPATQSNAVRASGIRGRPDGAKEDPLTYAEKGAIAFYGKEIPSIGKGPV